jgi:hypothetical protein
VLWLSGSPLASATQKYGWITRDEGCMPDARCGLAGSKGSSLIWQKGGSKKRRSAGLEELCQASCSQPCGWLPVKFSLALMYRVIAPLKRKSTDKLESKHKASDTTICDHHNLALNCQCNLPTDKRTRDELEFPKSFIMSPPRRRSSRLRGSRGSSVTPKKVFGRVSFSRPPHIDTSNQIAHQLCFRPSRISH